MKFFAIFFGIFYYAFGGNETERQFLFSLFLSVFQLILAWNYAAMVFFNLLNFFAIFLKFSLARQFGPKRNDNFYFLFLSLFQPILAWNDATMVFFDFFEFSSLFWNFLLRVRSEGNGKTIFIFSLSRHFATYFGLKWSHNGFFLIYWIFLLFFLNFL